MQPDYASIHHRKTHILYNLERSAVQFVLNMFQIAQSTVKIVICLDIVSV